MCRHRCLDALRADLPVDDAGRERTEDERANAKEHELSGKRLTPDLLGKPGNKRDRSGDGKEDARPVTAHEWADIHGL